MNSSESIAKLAAALVKAQAAFRAIGKSGKNEFDRYTYATLEDYVHGVRPILAEHGLAVLSSAEEVVPLDDRPTQKGGREHAVRVRVAVRLVHESGEWMEATAWGEGQDRADKAVYKAITGARKYGLALLCGLATSDDPEADEGVGRDAPAAAAPRQQQQQPQKPKQQPAKPEQRPAAKASPAQVKEVCDLLSVVSVPDDTLGRWFAKQGVEAWEDFTAEAIEGCIKYLKARRAPAHAA